MENIKNEKNSQNLIELVKKNSVINELIFISLFATDKQKIKYEDDKNNITSRKRDTILKSAQRVCDINYLGNKKYEIKKIYKYPVPINFSKMNSGLYKYLIPLILQKLIAQNIHMQLIINFSYYKWYHMIELVNENYQSMKSNIEYSAEEINVSHEIMREYFNNTDGMLSYYFKQCIAYFKEANLFGCNEIIMLCKRNSYTEKKGDRTKHDIKYQYLPATEQDLKNERICDEKACRFIGIEKDDKASKYFGEKSSAYLTKHSAELRKFGIMFFYRSYRIYSTDNDKKRCEKLVNSFDITNENKLINILNKEFTNIMIKNLSSRYDVNSVNDKKKNNIFKEIDKDLFLNTYIKIADTTLNKKAEIYNIPKEINKYDRKEIDSLIKNTMLISIDNEIMDIKGDVQNGI